MILDDTTRQRFAAGAAILAGIAVPSLFAGRVPIGVALAVALIAVAVTGFNAETLSRLARTIWSPLGLAVVVTLAAWLASAVGSNKAMWSLGVWAQTAAFLLAALYFRERLAEFPNARRLALKALIVASLVGVAVAVISLYLWPGLLEFFRTREIPSADLAAKALKSYGSAAACLVPLVVWAGHELRGAWRVAGYLYLPLAIALIVGVDAKAGYLGLAAAAAALVVVRLIIVLSDAPRRAMIAGLVVLGAVFVAVIVSHLPEIPYDPARGHWIPLWLVDAHRQVIWSFALERAVEAPWFGHGVDISGSLPGAKEIIPVFQQEYLPSHPHNWLVELFTETGGIGLAAALTALFLHIRSLAGKAARGETGAWAAVGLAGAFWGSMLVNFSIWAAWWQASFLFLTAIALAVPTATRAATGSDSAPGAVPNAR